MYIRFYRVSQKNGPEVTQSGPDPQRELGWPKVAQSGPKFRPPIIALKILKVHFFGTPCSIGKFLGAGAT